jgi:hypothetical protein
MVACWHFLTFQCVFLRPKQASARNSKICAAFGEFKIRTYAVEQVWKAARLVRWKQKTSSLKRIVADLVTVVVQTSAAVFDCELRDSDPERQHFP